MRTTELEFPLPTVFGEGLAKVPKAAPVRIDASLESVHEGIYASGTVATEAVAECSRCLDLFDLPLSLDFGDLFEYAGGSDDTDYVVEGDWINLEGVVRDAVVLALPFQPVCRPTCAGLDPETGERLPDGTEWTPEPTIDPRWAALQGFDTTSTGEGPDERE